MLGYYLDFEEINLDEFGKKSISEPIGRRLILESFRYYIIYVVRSWRILT